MASKQAMKRKQDGTATGVPKSAHRFVGQATPANIGEGRDVGASHSTAHGYLVNINSSDCITLREAAGECARLRVHHATPAIEEAGDAVAAQEATCMMDLIPQHQSLIPTGSTSGNSQPMGAAQEEGPAQPAVVLPPIETAQLQAGGLAFAINAYVAMPPAPPVLEYHNAVVTGAPNLAAGQDMIYPVLDIMHEEANFQPMGVAQEEGSVRPGIAVLPLVGAAAQLIQEGELAPAFDSNAIPAAPPVQDHNAVAAGALNLVAADQDMIHELIPLPQVPAAFDLVEFELGFKEWKHVRLRNDTLKRRSTQEIHDCVLEEDL